MLNSARPTVVCTCPLGFTPRSPFTRRPFDKRMVIAACVLTLPRAWANCTSSIEANFMPSPLLDGSEAVM